MFPIQDSTIRIIPEPLTRSQLRALRSIPNPKTMTSGEMGDAMRKRARKLKAKLPPNLAQTIDIFLSLAADVDAMDQENIMGEDVLTDSGKAGFIENLQRLDKLLAD